MGYPFLTVPLSPDNQGTTVFCFSFCSVTMPLSAPLHFSDCVNVQAVDVSSLTLLTFVHPLGDLSIPMTSIQGFVQVSIKFRSLAQLPIKHVYLNIPQAFKTPCAVNQILKPSPPPHFTIGANGICVTPAAQAGSFDVPHTLLYVNLLI